MNPATRMQNAVCSSRSSSSERVCDKKASITHLHIKRADRSYLPLIPLYSLHPHPLLNKESHSLYARQRKNVVTTGHQDTRNTPCTYTRKDSISMDKQQTPAPDMTPSPWRLQPYPAPGCDLIETHTTMHPTTHIPRFPSPEPITTPCIRRFSLSKRREG